MLLDFINSNRKQLITMTQAKVAARLAPRATPAELRSGVPMFLDDLAATLRHSLTPDGANGQQAARKHGAALLHSGYSVAQVVHDYGDICQAITELAENLDAPMSTEEFHILNLSLDNAIAEAVTEYMRLRDESVATGEAERLGAFAHELRNKLSVVQIGFQLVRSGRAPIGGSVASVIGRSLKIMNGLIDRALVEVRLESGNFQPRRVQLRQLMEDAEIEGALEAGVRHVSLSVSPTSPDVDVHVDPQILAGAIANVLQNAFKFTKPGGLVSLGTRLAGERVVIEIQDQCGGLPPGKADELFAAFLQRGSNREGLGLGLFISRKGIEANGGAISVRDIPGIGCVFAIDLPRLPPERASPAAG